MMLWDRIKQACRAFRRPELVHAGQREADLLWELYTKDRAAMLRPVVYAGQMVAEYKVCDVVTAEQIMMDAAIG